jgi:predicted metal-binding membrane protein
MLVLAAVGVMNIAAMAALAAVIFLEKLWSRGEVLSRAIGLAFIAIAVVTVFEPTILPALKPVTGGM